MVQRLSSLDEEDILLYGEVIDICKKERHVAQQARQDQTGPAPNNASHTPA